MGHGSPNKRHYTEKEIGALIQRATERHEEAMGESEHTLSLDEINQIAAGLGIPSKHVREAALELESGSHSDRQFSFWGGPFIVDQTRTVDGAMTEEQWEDIVLELRRFTGKKGHVGQIGRAREWSHSVGEGDNGFNFERTQVTIRPGDDETSIQIQKRYDGAAVLYPVSFFLFTFLMLLGLDDAGLSDQVSFAIAAGTLVGTFAAVRTFISWGARRHRERIRKMADRLRDLLSFSPSPQLTDEPVSEIVDIPGMVEPAPELIELPELDDPGKDMDDPDRITPEARRGIRS